MRGAVAGVQFDDFHKVHISEDVVTPAMHIRICTYCAVYVHTADLLYYIHL